MFRNLNLFSVSYRLVVSIFLVLVSVVSLLPIQVSAGILDLQKGANIQSRSNTDFNSSSFRQSVQNLKNLGANTVILVIPLSQSNIYSTDIGASWNTPTDETLTNGTAYIRSLGMNVNWKFFVDARQYDWRALISPSNKSEWFRNYTNQMLKYGRMAQSSNVEMVVIGTELAKLTMTSYDSNNTNYWKTLIRDIRGVYSGKLTYGANHGAPFAEKNEIGFWDDLDIIGLSAYFPLTNNSYPSVDELKNSWSNIDANEIRWLANRYGKPIIFTEIGYKATDRTFSSPGDHSIDGNYSEDNQANGYEAFFQYFANSSYVKGVQIWDWSSDPNYGAGNKDYSPQNKKAEQVLKKHFSGSGGVTPPVNQPIKLTSRVDLASATLNQNTTFNTVVTNTGNGNAPGSEYLVDVEVYESNGTFVYQDVQLGKDIAQGQTATFSSTWKPTKAATYVFKVGLFSRNWSKLYEWNNNAKTITVQGASQPPQSSNVQIWWPANNVSVTGVQPFQAVLENTSLNDYDMFWQVDGGGLVPMYNDSRGGGHKRFDVDLSGWRWKPSGAVYTINFVAKNKSGGLIGQKSVDIRVN
jgi:hypothetical protein